jgi:carboxymethylenebutenolidase
LPIYDPDHIEYDVTSGNIQIVMDNGEQLPAYWAHPSLGTKFPAIALVHDWWGVTPIVRRLAHFFAQIGHYVIVPDLFEGQVTEDPKQAMALVEKLGDGGYPRVHTSLSVLEQHHQSNRDVAVIGLGMGGSLAFEAAIVRDDLEAAVAFGGFPQRYFGRFDESNTPILACYGSEEPHIKANVIKKLRQELAQSPQKLPHQVEIIDGLGHDFFVDGMIDTQREQSRDALSMTTNFLEQFLEGPSQPPRQVI